MSEKPSYIPCGICLNYFVTFDAKRPHGCKKFGFKSIQSPSFAVFAATGTNCALFKSKFRPTDDAKVKTGRRMKLVQISNLSKTASKLLWTLRMLRQM